MKQKNQQHFLPPLSQREWQMLELLQKQKSVLEIAESLNWQPASVIYYVNNIHWKLNLLSQRLEKNFEHFLLK